MTFRNRPRIAATLSASLLAALALGGCRQEQPAPSDTPQAPAADAAAMEPAPAATTEQVGPPKIAGTDAIAVSENTMVEPGDQVEPVTVAGTEPKDFAGTFSAGGTTLQLQADGTYAMTPSAAGADSESTGTWTVEADGKMLLLDSNDKGETDRRLAVVSKDELKASEGGQVLRRTGAP